MGAGSKRPMSIPWMKRIVELGGGSEEAGATVADAHDCMGPDRRIEENHTKIGEDLTEFGKMTKMT